MFLLSTILGTSSNGPTDGFSQLFETENKIEGLEELLKNAYLGGSSDVNSIDTIKQQLAQARQEESSFLSTFGDSLEHDPSVRYDEIKSDELAAEQRVTELQTSLEKLKAEQASYQEGRFMKENSTSHSL